MEEDAELWLDFIKRDITWWAEVDLPEKPDYETYTSLREQLALEVEEDAKRMEQAMKGLAKRVETKIVDPMSKGLPRLKGSRKRDPWHRSTAPTKLKSGLPAAFKRNKRLEIPTHRLNNGAPPRVSRAPPGLLNDYRVSSGKLPAPRTASNPGSAASLSKTGPQQTVRPRVSHIVGKLNPGKPQTKEAARSTAAASRPRDWTNVTGTSSAGNLSDPQDRKLPQTSSPFITPKQKDSGDTTYCPAPGEPTPPSKPAPVGNPPPRQIKRKRPAANPLLMKPKRPRTT